MTSVEKLIAINALKPGMRLTGIYPGKTSPQPQHRRMPFVRMTGDHMVLVKCIDWDTGASYELSWRPEHLELAT